MDYYILTGLKANSVYNISVAAITGEDNDIIGDYASVISMTPVGRKYDDLLPDIVDVQQFINVL